MAGGGVVNNKALALVWDQSDKNYFVSHPDRKAHIRNTYQDECKGEFWMLGEHDKDRRRIVIIRVDYEGNSLPDNKVLKIPMLAFSDESIEDSDEVLLPIVKQLMAEAFQREKRR